MPLRPLILRYLMVMMACIVALIAMDLIAFHLFGYDLGSGTTILTTIVPAMDAGQRFARETMRGPEPGESWRISRVLWLCGMGLSGFLAAAIIALAGVDLSPLFEVVGVRLIVMIFGVAALFTLLLTRWFFAIGARGEIKRQQKTAARHMQ